MMANCDRRFRIFLRRNLYEYLWVLHKLPRGYDDATCSSFFFFFFHTVVNLLGIFSLRFGEFQINNINGRYEILICNKSRGTLCIYEINLQTHFWSCDFGKLHDRKMIMNTTFNFWAQFKRNGIVFSSNRFLAEISIVRKKTKKKIFVSAIRSPVLLYIVQNMSKLPYVWLHWIGRSPSPSLSRWRRRTLIAVHRDWRERPQDEYII